MRFIQFAPIMIVATMAAAAAAQVSQEPETRIGLIVAADPGPTRDSVRRALSVRLMAAGVQVLDDCEEVTFCVTVAAVPVRLGKREGGVALASYVARHLLAHPDWPWQPPPPPPPGAPAPPAIEDAFTAGGDLSCVPCERRLEALEREVKLARAVAEGTMVDEADLQVQVGPATEAFLLDAAGTVAEAVVTRHLRPWQASRAGR